MDIDEDASGESQEQPEGGRESERPKSRPTALRELAQVLAGGDDAQSDDDTPGESQAGAEDQGGDESHKPPETLAEAAERLGVDVAELYKLRIPDPHREGESFSLGDLKDQREQLGGLEVQRIEWEESRASQQAELLRSQQELEELLRHVPKRLLESDALTAAQKRLDARADRERQLTLQRIPEWKNAETMRGDLTGMIEYLQGYGFPKEYLASVTDHRTLMMIRDSWQRKQRIDAALAQVQKRTQERGRPSQSGRKPPTQETPQATRRSNPSEKRSMLIGLMQPSEG